MTMRLFDNDKVVEHNVARPKPQRVGTKEKQPNEEEVIAEENRQEEEARRKFVEDKEKQVETIENNQKEIVQLKGRLNNERKKCLRQNLGKKDYREFDALLTEVLI